LDDSEVRPGTVDIGNMITCDVKVLENETKNTDRDSTFCFG